MNPENWRSLAAGVGIGLMVAACAYGVNSYFDSKHKSITIYAGGEEGATSKAANILKRHLEQQSDGGSFLFNVAVITTKGTDEIIDEVRKDRKSIGIIKVASQKLSGLATVLKMYSEYIHFSQGQELAPIK